MIRRVEQNFFTKVQNTQGTNFKRNREIEQQSYTTATPKMSIQPLENFCAINNISFTSRLSHVPEMELDSYLSLSDSEKYRLRQKCMKFDKTVSAKDLVASDKRYLPLSAPFDMDNFVDFSKQYNNLKEHPIFCLGRSPKWFLDTSSWMKGGIDSYKYVAFSKYWYQEKIDPKTFDTYLTKVPELAPTEAQENAYKLYLKLIKADPKSIVEAAQKTGNSAVITDYVAKSKGFTSYLDLMARYAKSQGVLEDFTKSINFYKIGCLEHFNASSIDGRIEVPKIIIPASMAEAIPKTNALWGSNSPKQEFHDMELSVFEELIENENANECRSTFYPKEYWTKFKPCHGKPTLPPGMSDFKNLVNFKILDYLNKHKLIRRV